MPTAPPTSLDLDVLRAIAAHRTGWGDALVRGVMWVGTTPLALVVVVLLLAVLTVAKSAYRTAMTSALALALATGAAVWLKGAFARPRPPQDLTMVHPGGWAFPSTHAAATAALAVAVLTGSRWASARQARSVAVVLALALGIVGVCMVYLGAHWVTDVLAGWVVGGAIGAALGWTSRRALPTRRR